MHRNTLNDVFTDCSRQLFVAAVAITKNVAAAEDAVHDGLIAVASLRKQPNNLKAYLFTTVRNKALHHLKREKRSSHLDEDYLEESVNQDNNIEETEVFIRQVSTQIKQLNSNEQQCLIMKLFEDLTFQEISEIMDASPNTVASWYRRGLVKLKEKLHEPR